MVQSYYTLAQAADLLGKATDELNQMVRRGEIRAFADGGSWKFRTQDIDELKRTQELLSEYNFSVDDTGSTSFDDISLGDVSMTPTRKASDSSVGRQLQGEPGKTGSGESDVRLIFSDSRDGSDSDIMLVPDLDDDPAGASGKSDGGKGPGDSDIRLSEPTPSSDSFELPLPTSTSSSSGLIPLKSDDEDLFEDSDDEILLDAGSSPAGGMTPPLSAATAQEEIDFSFEDDLGTGFKVDGDDADLDLSDLNLADKTPTVKQSAGDDENSDFDLDIDDIGLAQDIAPGAGDSGINLGRPDDSGILLKKAAQSGINLKPEDTDSGDSEYDVTLDSDDDIFGSDEVPGFKASDTAPRMAKAIDEDSSDEISDSDFEMAIDDDIEVEGESGSEVVALEDDEEDSSEDFDEEFDEEQGYGGTSAEPLVVAPVAAPWGGPWVALLSVTTVVFTLVMMMMYEITRNAWSYNKPFTLTATITDWFYSIGKSAGLMP